MQPPAHRLSLRELLLISVSLIFTLIVQASLSRSLSATGFGKLEAHYLAYLTVPVILLAMLAPALREHRNFLKRLLSPHGLSVRLVLAAVALGLVSRIAWWSQLLARVSFGNAVSDDLQVVVGPVFAWACPPLPSLFLGLFVMAVLIPPMEEIVHRGFLQSAVMHRGPLPAVLISALVFTAFHPSSSYWVAFIMGIVLGIQFCVTGSLWGSMITHATYNGLVQLDWRCLEGHWNPPPGSLPQLLPGAAAIATLVCSMVLVVALLRWQWAGARTAPDPGS